MPPTSCRRERPVSSFRADISDLILGDVADGLRAERIGELS